MYDRRLQVFVSSGMQELSREREVIKTALDTLKVDAWVFEHSAGSRPQSIQQTYLDELKDADLYLVVFWKAYGDYTIDEFQHAHLWKKDCLVYEKRVEIQHRDPRLEAFLTKIGDVKAGLTSQWFHTAEELAEKVKTDVARWQANRARQALILSLEDERERQTRSRAQELAATRQRVVNFAPQGIAELLKDRSEPITKILKLLLAKDSSVRVVIVYGQGGIGKTALACRVMLELDKNETVHGLVYLRTRTTGISFERI